MTDIIGTEELRDSIRGVLTDRRGGSYAMAEDAGAGFDAELWNQMAELGWLGLALPEDAGGLDLGMRHLAVLYEELGRDLSAVPALPTMMAAMALVRHGDDPASLAGIAAGELRVAMALPATHECLTSDGRDVSGTVRDVAFADVADILFLPLEQEGETVLAIVPAGLEGVEIAARSLVDLTRSAADVTLRRVALSDIRMVRPGEDGWAELLDHAAIGLAADAVGGATALFDMTVEYLKTREQFGRPIGSFQALKHRAASWKTLIEAMTAQVRNAAALVDSGSEGASAAASGAHILACQTYEAFSADSVQLHGGIGFTWEHPCHLFLKRANFARFMFGSVKDHQERVAKLAFERDPTENQRPAAATLQRA